MTVRGGFQYGTHEILIYCVFFVSMMAATEIGFRFGRWSEAIVPEAAKDHLSTIEAAILGILALLLGFTMSMAVTRFEARRQLVVDEANAIGTSSLRTQLLPAPEGPEIASLLRQYVDVRVQYGTAEGDELARLDSLRAEGVRLQNEFWTRAVAYGQKDPNPVKAGLLLQSLNQVIDLEATRWAAFNNHVPASVIYVNAIVGLLAAVVAGYALGVNGRRQIFSTCMLVLVITLVLSVIVDIDRPRSGFIRISQQPMRDLQRQR